MVRIRGVKCALGDHKLVEPSTNVRDPKLVKFVRMRIHDFRPELPVCERCLRNVQKLYNEKMDRARQMKRQKSMQSISSSTDVENSRRSVARRRQEHRQQAIAARRNSNKKTVESSTTTSSSQSTLDEGPSTSAQAAAKRAQREGRGAVAVRRPPARVDNDSSDEEYEPSPNALNGTRLPHIQPILKRTQFVHANRDVLEIYMAGLTGG